MKLNIFNTANLFEAATNLFQQLGIKLNSNTAEPLPVKDLLKQHYKDNDTFKTIGKTYFIGIIDNTVFQATGMFDVNYSYKEALQQGDKNYDGLMLFALELSKQPTRTEISDLTRTFNRISQKMPVALVLKYKTGNEACFSIAISERFKYKQNWRQGEKAGKVIILRDIHTETTHAGHERILLDLVKPVGVANYDQLHQHWLLVLDVNILNKKFFQDLANWYFWAMDNVSFPDDLEKKKDVRNATNLIRLITRVVFIWFIKEKSLVPNALFNKANLDKILKDFNKNKKSQNYYHAILQNLFFGTLNQKMDERKFAKDGGNIKTNGEEYGVKNLFRYADLFNISEKEAMQLFKDVPFLNGGLFDCLDKPNEEGKIVYVDGFSRNTKKQASVPDYIFFGEEKEVDLNEIYGTRNKTYKSRGLINLLESYKFTVAENTPIEEEIALDPELLGKVFENLLASYNPETQTTARKQTGSFYTPREIVNYMVDESLLEYIKQNVTNESNDFETRLRELISYVETPNPFDEKETKALIEGINNCKILDPACGSGAYPMGILHKMVHLLQKLDPENKYWKALQRQKAMEETESAFKIGDKEERGKRLAEINDVFENNASDYGRKLYLIENCIYGIDIQPIAVQISKLRFFISLIIDQSKQATKENFGIRSLPNLETKFVAANTLIGLDKPAQTLLRNPEIEVKENQLKELRHKYFTANTRKEKLQYQKQDKKLRQEIAKMLESDGWQTAVAKQIVAFDPYDQNTFAPWFDPEWMFGLTTGFDIVIGNPPYVSYYSNTGSSLSEKEKKYFVSNYEGVLKANDRINSMNLMTEKGIKILKPKGHLSFITNKTIAVLPSYMEVRKFILNKSKISYLVTDLDPFDAIVDCVVIGLNKEVSKDYRIKWYKGDIDNFEEKNINELNTNSKLEFNFSSHQNILGKIDLAKNKLEDLITINRGVNIGGCFDEFLSNTKLSKNYWKYLSGTRNVNRYFYQWYESDGYMKFDSVLESKLREQGATLALGNHQRYKTERLLIPESGQFLMAAYCNEECYSAYGIMVGTSSNSKYSIKYSCALLNSMLLTFYAVEKEILRKGKKATPHVGVKGLNSIPVHFCKKETEAIINKLVDYCSNSKQISLNSESAFFERLIDAMVYELYLPEEIKAGGAEVLKHLGNLPEIKDGQDEKNIKTITKVYKELSDPKHPISAALLKLLNIEEVNIIEGRV
jgi:adenine-specific DNA-methyltransferase